MRSLLTSFLVLFLAVPAYADGSGISMGVIDKDPNGTNVRDAPGGKVVKVLPGAPKTDEDKEKRVVTVTGQKGQWFSVRLHDDSTGWLHSSMIGTCASATEDGDPVMKTNPDDSSPAVAKVKQGTPLRLLEIKGVWAKVETADSGAKKTGWMMEHTLSFNAYRNCWAR